MKLRPAPAPTPRLTLRADLRDAEGEPRICLALPGNPVPLAFPTLAAALATLAALREAEAAHVAR